MAIRRPDTCARCDAPLPSKTRAWWDSDERTVTCVLCRPQPQPAAPEPQPLPPPKPIDHGTGGISAQREYERRAERAQRRHEEAHGTGIVGKATRLLTPEPRSTAAWAKGADGERRLAAHLDRDLGSVATVLHDRRVPKTRGNIDHLVVAPSGIWIVDAKNYSGRVEQRNGRGTTPGPRLFVAGRDRTNLVESMGWQLQAVHQLTDLIGFGAVPIGRCICFTNAQWPLFAKPFTIDGVWIGWGEALTARISADVFLEPATVNLLAHLLSERLPAAR